MRCLKTKKSDNRGRTVGELNPHIYSTPHKLSSLQTRVQHKKDFFPRRSFRPFLADNIPLF